MSIPPRFMEELRSRLTLSDIIGRTVRLTRAGREHKGCCPFHNEKTPSFTVNDDKQFYHCFGCGAHGDVIGFTMQNGNLSFIEAVEALAAEAGMQVPAQSPQEIEKSKKEKSLYSLLEDATRWMEGQLRDPSNKEAYRYIVERGNTDEELSNFRVGYAPSDGQAVRKALQALGYSDAQMIEAGVLRAGKSGREPYAFFRERIMFPVTDRRGRVVAFGGRILPDHLRPPDQGDYTPAKYMNSSDTPLFHKGSQLYGEPRARQAAIDGQDIIVVEGYVDVMACVKAGYAGAVAPLGTALTEEQIMVLWRMIPDQRKVPILCFDGDNAGRRAAARACERILPLLKPDHSARFAFLPDGQDPDSLVNGQGKKALQSVLEAAMPLVDFIWLYH
ncbi:MAG TPA: DNA primase, partial [Alphaproteobacteria bacterium]|nr:DNA primase [Alphaproteobacteria bacterium]